MHRPKRKQDQVSPQRNAYGKLSQQIQDCESFENAGAQITLALEEAQCAVTLGRSKDILLLFHF